MASPAGADAGALTVHDAPTDVCALTLVTVVLLPGAGAAVQPLGTVSPSRSPVTVWSPVLVKVVFTVWVVPASVVAAADRATYCAPTVFVTVTDPASAVSAADRPT